MLRLAFIVLSVLTLAGCETMQAVDRGLYQAADTVTQTDRVTGERVLSLHGRETQIAKGNEAAQALLSEYDRFNEAVDAAQYLRAKTIFERVHSVSHLKDEQWTLVLTPDESFNAFVTGGTYVVVHLGLMQQLDLDDEVAAVMGHELGHVAANHPFEQRTHAIAAALANSSSAQTDTYGAAYEHESEREADKIGVLYAALAGYDPLSAGRVWRKKFEEQGNFRIAPGGEVPLKTHPVHSERAAETSALGTQVLPYYTPGQINPEAARLLADNTLWRYETDTLEASAGSGGGVLAVLGTALGAYTAHLNAKSEALHQQQRAQLTQYADQNSVVLEHGAVDEKTWGVKFQYKGYRTLTYMVVAADFVMPDNKHIRVIAELKGNILPGSVHAVTFSDERLTEVDRNTAKVLYTVDDAADPLTM